MTALPLTIRELDPETDLALVLSSWQHQSARPSMPRGVMLALLEKQGAAVACCKDHPEQIFGWACGGSDTLHMVYVRRGWRARGVATALMGHLFPDLGHRPIFLTTRPRIEHKAPKAWAGLVASWKLRWSPYHISEAA